MELAGMAQDYGIIEKSGSWMYIFADTDREVKVQGANKLREYLSENKEVFEEIRKKVNEIQGI